jgi:hypothetical protein
LGVSTAFKSTARPIVDLDIASDGQSKRLQSLAAKQLHGRGRQYRFAVLIKTTIRRIPAQPIAPMPVLDVANLATLEAAERAAKPRQQTRNAWRQWEMFFQSVKRHGIVRHDGRVQGAEHAVDS